MKQLGDKFLICTHNSTFLLRKKLKYHLIIREYTPNLFLALPGSLFITMLKESIFWTVVISESHYDYIIFIKFWAYNHLKAKTFQNY